jgi:Na+/H+ antiporter NhaC
LFFKGHCLLTAGCCGSTILPWSEYATIFLVSFHLCLGFPSDLFPSMIPTKIL